MKLVSQCIARGHHSRACIWTPDSNSGDRRYFTWSIDWMKTIPRELLKSCPYSLHIVHCLLRNCVGIFTIAITLSSHDACIEISRTYTRLLRWIFRRSKLLNMFFEILHLTLFIRKGHISNKKASLILYFREEQFFVNPGPEQPISRIKDSDSDMFSREFAGKDSNSLSWLNISFKLISFKLQCAKRTAWRRLLGRNVAVWNKIERLLETSPMGLPRQLSENRCSVKLYA